MYDTHVKRYFILFVGLLHLWPYSENKMSLLTLDIINTGNYFDFKDMLSLF